MGLIASAIFWTTAALSIAVNPWFDFFRDAFSDLGGPGAGDPWIYNTGLIVAAVFLGLFSMDIIASSSNKLEAVGGAYISISAVFLALIGIYHAGHPASRICLHLVFHTGLPRLLDIRAGPSPRRRETARSVVCGRIPGRPGGRPSGALALGGRVGRRTR
jgi:Predicted membrane protein